MSKKSDSKFMKEIPPAVDASLQLRVSLHKARQQNSYVTLEEIASLLVEELGYDDCHLLIKKIENRL